MKSLMTTVLGISLSLLASQVQAAPALCGEPGLIKAKKSLVITDLSVVNDARAKGNGSWSFAKAFAGTLPGAAKLGEAAFAWMDLFGTVETHNGYPVGQRVPGPLLDHWPEVGQPDGASPIGTNLDIKRAPMRLLAIVYRPDLVDNDTAPAGEGRLVFGATDNVLGKKNMTVIFEFALPTDITLADGQRTTVKFWQQSFAALSLESFGDAYNARLERLTNLFVNPDDGRTHIHQVRTNEQLFGQGWDLREFNPDAASAKMVLVSPGQSPDVSLNTVAATELVTWIKQNSGTIQAGTHKMPKKFLGGSSFLIDDNFTWLEGAGIDSTTRAAFAKSTCSGCHGGETLTRFLHINPRLEVESARLSAFLVNDMAKRQRLLQAAVCPQ